MNMQEAIMIAMKAIGNAGGCGSGDGGLKLEDLGIFVGDFLNRPPEITYGALNTLTREIYGV
jgi:hypothetical protein